MEEPKLYSRAEMVDKCGLDDLALTFWLRKELLKSDVTETRRHRRFPLSELRFAKVLTVLRLFGVNVRHMADVLSFLRNLEQMQRMLPTHRRLGDVIAAIEDGISPDDFTQKLEAWGCDHTERAQVLGAYNFIVEEVVAGVSMLSAWKLALAYIDREKLGVVVHDNGMVWMHFVTSLESETDFDGMLMLDLKSIFAGLEE